jgi:glycosyltransferase involved in cell wall biosynthesis
MPLVAIVHNHPIYYKHLLFTALASRGLDIEVLYVASGSRSRIEGPELAHARYRFRIGSRTAYEDGRPWHTARFVWSALSEIRPRIVIISGWADVAAWTAKIWSKLHHRSTVLWAESNEFDRPRVFWKERIKAEFLRGFSSAHVYGTSNFEYLVKLGFDPQRIYVKRAVSDMELFFPGERSSFGADARRVVLYVGRFSPEKNLDLVLDTICQLSPAARQKLLFRFVGYGPLDDHLRAKALALGIGEMVEFLGPKRLRELPEVYRSSAVLLLPSISEPWGLVVNEAMLCRVPAIVSDHCGCARDMVQPGTGWVFPARDRQALKGVLEEVAAIPSEVLETMGRDAETLGRIYSADNCAELVIRSLRSTGVLPEGWPQAHSAARSRELGS